MRRIISYGLIFGILFTRYQLALSATADSISQWGITWHFSQAHEYGQFANGDYWVLGPVTITRIEPDFSGGHNGWEVNPSVGTTHGFDAGCKNGSYSAAKIPALPYTSSAPVESIVKVISSGASQPCVETAAVLTVVNAIPAGNGGAIFRPPYTGSDKPFYAVSDLRLGLLPNYAPVGTPPSLSTVEQSFAYFRLEHLTSPALRDLRPSIAMENYNPKNGPRNHEALMRLMLDDSPGDKLQALIKVVQHGIDKCHAVMQGWVVSSADGHDPGHRVLAAFAATLLGIDAAKQALLSATGFHEDRTYAPGKNTSGQIPLWGVSSTEGQYWGYLRGLGGNRSNRDPYGYIDGGLCGEEYQLIVAQGHKGSILATHLMPSLKEAWNPATWAVTANYVDRWVRTGTWAQPDPCAPYDGNPDHYGTAYGPSASNPSGCILDPDLQYYNDATDFGCTPGSACGRFPAKQGKDTDGGMYKSAFVTAMWEAYRTTHQIPLTDHGMVVSDAGPRDIPSPASDQVRTTDAVGAGDRGGSVVRGDQGDRDGSSTPIRQTGRQVAEGACNCEVGATASLALEGMALICAGALYCARRLQRRRSRHSGQRPHGGAKSV